MRKPRIGEKVSLCVFCYWLIDRVLWELKRIVLVRGAMWSSYTKNIDIHYTSVVCASNFWYRLNVALSIKSTKVAKLAAPIKKQAAKKATSSYIH